MMFQLLCRAFFSSKRPQSTHNVSLQEAHPSSASWTLNTRVFTYINISHSLQSQLDFISEFQPFRAFKPLTGTGTPGSFCVTSDIGREKSSIVF